MLGRWVWREKGLVRDGVKGMVLDVSVGIGIGTVRGVEMLDTEGRES